MMRPSKLEHWRPRRRTADPHFWFEFRDLVNRIKVAGSVHLVCKFCDDLDHGMEAQRVSNVARNTRAAQKCGRVDGTACDEDGIGDEVYSLPRPVDTCAICLSTPLAVRLGEALNACFGHKLAAFAQEPRHKGFRHGLSMAGVFRGAIAYETLGLDRPPANTTCALVQFARNLGDASRGKFHLRNSLAALEVRPQPVRRQVVDTEILSPPFEHIVRRAVI